MEGTDYYPTAARLGINVYCRKEVDGVLHYVERWELHNVLDKLGLWLTFKAGFAGSILENGNYAAGEVETALLRMLQS